MALRPLHILSLCSGGGGLDLGVDLACGRARPVCYVEREAFAVARVVEAMRKGLLAEAPIWSDVSTFAGRPWRGLVDGLVGGIPCQPHSLAGKRGGSTDERDLWSATRRIIVQARPWFVLIENVAGMLTAGADEVPGALRVRRDLRKLGFAVEGGLFTAEEVGAPHERQRVFILGVADRNGTGQCGQSSQGLRRADILDSHGRCAGLADAFSPGLEGRGPHGHRAGQRPASERGGGALADADLLELRRQPPAGQQRKHEPDAGDGCGAESGHVANANELRCGAWRQPDVEHWRAGGRALTAPADGDVVNAAGERWGEGRPRSELRGGRSAVAGAGGGDVVDAFGRGRDGRPDGAERGALKRAVDEQSSGLPLFPPGPADLPSWRAILGEGGAPELEPAVRRVADGLASRLDLARVDRLRLLGNGVVPLEAAYALRTLATRLARRSAGAGELVRMMDATHRSLAA